MRPLCRFSTFHVPDLDRPFCDPGCMIAKRITPMHHVMSMGSPAPAGGGLAGGGRRDAEQGIRPGLRLEAG
jgi:hypothetical protein